MGKKVMVFLAVVSFLAGFIVPISFAFDPEHVKKLNESNKCPKCDLSKANLSGIDYMGANLVGANLSGANLTGAVLWDADLTDANLKDANIKDTNFSGTKLSNTIWTDGRKCKSGSIGKCK